MTDSFLILESRGDSTCSIVKADRPFISSWKCGECHRPLPGLEGVDVRIQGIEPDDAPLTHLSNAFLMLCRRDLLAALGERNVAADLHLGNVRNEHDVLLGDWVTMYGRHRVILRAHLDAKFRICSTCGQPIYYAGGSPYLYPEPPKDVATFDGNARLVVRKSSLESVDFSRWPKLRVTEVRVFNHARDGLGDLTLAIPSKR